MNTQPKRNFLTDRQERELTILMAGGIHTDRARLEQSLGKVRLISNVPEHAKRSSHGPLSRKQEAIMAREMAGGKYADRAMKRESLAKIRLVTQSPEKSVAPKKPDLPKSSPAEPQRKFPQIRTAEGKSVPTPANDNKPKTPAPGKPAKSKSGLAPANDNRVKALEPGQSGIAHFNGRTFVHRSKLESYQAMSAERQAQAKQAEPPKKRNLLERLKSAPQAAQKAIAAKKNIVAKAAQPKPPELTKAAESKSPLSPTATNNSPVKPLQQGMPGVIQFNGRTFVHQSQLPGAKAAAAPSAPKRNIVAPVTKSSPPPPRRERGRDRS